MITLGKLKITKEDILIDITLLEHMMEFGEDYIIRLLMLILTEKMEQNKVPCTVVGQFEAERLREKIDKLRSCLDHSSDMSIEQIKIVLEQN